MQAPVRERREIAVQGIVQGVGFRPFIYTLAGRFGLAGLVCNDAHGVHIEVEGEAPTLDAFVHAIEAEAPALAVVEGLTWRYSATRGEAGFRIEGSQEGVQRRALVSPDVATCADCLAELFDPSDRRYRYPFINCTNCGPRFTITRSVPYDRATTTMAPFIMCSRCHREYEDPANRRFHAQPNACPTCGPQVQLLNSRRVTLGLDDSADPIKRTAMLLQAGAIVAIKGLGGYHLACDPWNDAAVATLRSRKARQDKPFALMVRDVSEARQLCRVTAEEELLLTSRARPIVLLQRRTDSTVAGIADEVAPRQKALGIMLAYTPLHHLLLADVGAPLVMTSGNRSDEPIAYRDEEVFLHLSGIADYFLVHDRSIHMRCDDSVTRVVRHEPYPLRRSRGNAPAPLRLSRGLNRHILACGGELKTTFCVARDRRAFLSHHIGDLENYETLRSYREGIDHFCRLFDVRPEVVAHDLHPDYLSTAYAQEREEEGLLAVGVQHHHAHIAACLADNECPVGERVVGVALDGTGYGTDGAIWGGEFFVGTLEEGFRRSGHMEYVPLPGGATAIREPWRMALSHLLRCRAVDDVLRLPLPFVRRVAEETVRAVAGLVQTGTHAPPTSSAGRLFDAVAALLGLPGSMRTTYEGQAAIELEQTVSRPGRQGYPVRLKDGPDGWLVDTAVVIEAVLEDVLGDVPTEQIASRFHQTMIEIVVQGCRRTREDVGGGADPPTAVALSGGTFQNMILLEGAASQLEKAGFSVYVHRRVPANDGGLSLGQVVLADMAVLYGKG